MNKTFYVTIGNSDDKLSQEAWSEFIDTTIHTIDTLTTGWEGQWYSSPISEFRNACFAFHLEDEAAFEELKMDLNELREHFNQDSITLATAEVEFI